MIAEEKSFSNIPSFLFLYRRPNIIPYSPFYVYHVLGFSFPLGTVSTMSSLVILSIREDCPRGDNHEKGLYYDLSKNIAVYLS